MKYFGYFSTRTILLIVLASVTFILGFAWKSVRPVSCETPSRIVGIRGNVTQMDNPRKIAGGTLVFQKVGCESCYIGAKVNGEGRYEILVGDGKYKVMYMDPIEDLDYLAPDQPRFIDTDTIESKKISQSVFDFDIKLKAVESIKRSGE